MYSFALTPHERMRAIQRRDAFLAVGSREEYAHIVYERTSTRESLEALLKAIDTDLKRCYGLHPHQVARYGGVNGALHLLRVNHPNIEEFHLQYTYYMDRLLLLEDAWTTLRHILALKRFAMRVVPSFREHYYRPPWGRGARLAIRRLKAGI